jgi:hypothetical protein
MPGPPKKIAVVVTHGMGEQVPMETLRGVVETAWVGNTTEQWPETPPDEKAEDIWFMPGLLAGSLELRRITTRWTRSRAGPTARGPRADFFEFYWADLTEGTTVQEVWDWIRMLLWRTPARVPDGLMPTWLALWAAAILITVFSLLAVLPWPGGWWHVIFAGIAAAIAYAMQYVISPYIGDVARYVRAEPRNIAIRRAIRERGLKLLQDIHDSHEYERVIFVAHSLGTIVAYDLVSLFWTMRRDAAVIAEDEPAFDKLRAVEEAAHALAAATNESRDDRLLAFREAQRSFRLALRSGGEDGTARVRTPGEEWLISDLVTLGSPLTHAVFLLSRDPDDLKEKIDRFLFPTCPPQFQPVQTEQRRKIDARPNPPPSEHIYGPKGGLFSYFRAPPPQTWSLHHAAPFAAVRWTNIYDPHHLIYRGDLISGPLVPFFGGGIIDINLKALRGQSPGFSHTLYWDPTANDPKGLHIKAMRTAIDLLDTPDRELWKEMMPMIRQ